MLTYIHDANVKTYPTSVFSFSPDSHFPEYPFSSLAQGNNDIYSLVRRLLYKSGLDKQHFNTSQWNPLGEFISSGNTVLLKPNWVENKNKNGIDPSLSCLVTNPSVVRAILDYVYIALKGSGRIILADAPMQGCNLPEMFRITGYDKLIEFYEKHGVIIEVRDLRKYHVDTVTRGVLSRSYMTEDTLGSVVVDLGRRSLHADNDSMQPKYKVEDYLEEDTKNYHSDGHHRYEINKAVLEADVIINIPKPKTHRLAGITGAVKNFVGTTYEKASLPHRIEGDLESGYGDAYLKHSIWKQWMNLYNEKRTKYAKEGKVIHSKLSDLLMKTCYMIGSKTSGDYFRIGSWYGNDTIWRTAIDLNNIALHVDSDGVFHDRTIRRIISISDMIIAGEKEGPVGPTPRPIGILIMSDNAMLHDNLVCRIMGFSDNKLRMFNDKRALAIFGYDSKETMIENEVDGKKLKDLKFDFFFEPHPCWKGHIESYD